ncbi:uncharacterized protein PRCAT00004190001 [Priceomyces carsonii]|uniref:uncharacterized protein n=1 Tax=Priceomyces carsonii TaxID=28549 RepID=UPI002ED96C90|nr:unnamed protein product [Priceomyces carsonii]
MPSPPPNAYSPGTKLTVGSHKISITKYISEGGFALVYTCTIEPPFRGSKIACLKRVVVPNKWQLSLLRQEVDAMRRLRGNEYIVSYIDSHASRMKTPTLNLSSSDQQQYEVFLLMEYCEKNGLIDFMNTRLTHKLTEPEILEIMHDVTIGVAMCHHLKPPLIHRDIKIENVLIDSGGKYKLCDFGSAVGYQPAPKSAQELQTLHDDIMHHTTPQYRAPEMIDLSKGFPIDDKLDIWALGCFLYKLCYYTTPFELPNQKSMQDLEQTILNCSHTLRFRDQPGLIFSPRLKNVIKCCLREDPRRRPNAAQLLGEICSMQGRKSVPNIIPLSVRELQVKNLKSGTKSNTSIANDSSLSLHKSVTEPPVKDTNSLQEVTPKTKDPFASIDKTKFLQSVSTPDVARREGDVHSRPKSTYIPSSSHLNNVYPSRPMSTYINKDDHYRSFSPNNSTHSLKDFVNSQLRSNEYMATSNEYDSGTLDFLRTKEEENHLGLRQSTGGSLKNTIKSSLRKISTGGSSTQSLGYNQTGAETSTKNKRSSVSSIRNVFSKRKTSSSPESFSDEVTQVHEEPQIRKLSIQRRMQLLFDNSKDSSIKKTADGYGKYTDTAAVEDIAAINNESISTLAKEKSSSSTDLTKPTRKVRALTPPKVPRSLSQHQFSSTAKSSITTPSSTMSENKISRKAPKELLKKAPPKPKKPIYLKSVDSYQKHDRKPSDASDTSLPDVDDLERHFSRRFPSFV